MQKDGTILVVDDSVDERELIEMSLRAVGVTCNIRALRDGSEAIAYLAGEGAFADRAANPYPTLILTDLKMPGADGFAVLEFLRTHIDHTVIPTVVFSGSSDADDIRTAYRLGASSYIVKPTRTDELQRRLRVMMEYWLLCEAPAISASGEHLRTDSRGKLGERFSAEPFPPKAPK
ncbi:MAG TPA: response regulator [Opitutus sp.]|nr:response regulator [Opitutus sp.]